MKNLILTILIIFIFNACSTTPNENITYKNSFFIYDKSTSLTKNDIKSITYKKALINPKNENLYNVIIIFNKTGYAKLHELFKQSEGKSFGIIVNNNLIQFGTKILTNFFQEASKEEKKLILQYKKEDAILLLKSFE
ncbi:hypothetical protein B0F89_105116 [Malaciobacter marinus]|jgi:hypothetical protein|uniref:Lipoprotein n=1 Tax=Malaciobacter marinus TaxID=505249 RepID=A0AB36ZX23_9BACT|nr:hypothetical protein [Malaciobacter marinus]PPK62183.1 hypothetical protein B0F89_105116 [Malaciobacter marinus]